MWIDIAAIVFVCTAVNHLGLIAAIERVIRHRLPVVNCPKCLTCWSVFAYGIATVPYVSPQIVARLLAISLLCSYLAIWLELLMYAIDTLYNRIYVKIENISQEHHDEESE
jgi:hypothetical protein